MKRLLIIIGLVFLGATLVFLNQGVRKSAMPDKDEDEQAQAQQAKAPQTRPQTLTPIDPKATLPPEETVGNPSRAKHHIAMGWVYNEANQQRPESLAVPVQSVRDYVMHTGGRVSAEIVDLDIPAEDRSPAARAVTAIGIRVDGRTLFAGNPSDVPASEEMIANQLNSAINKK